MNSSKTRFTTQTIAIPFLALRLLTATMLLSPLNRAVGADEWPDAWRNRDQWDVVGDAMLDPGNPGRLQGNPGKGVLVNGKTGRAQSLVTEQTFQDVEVHVEFLVAKNSNSGVIFHGNHEIQILDSYGVKQPTARDCGGIYPRAEGQPGTPSYHHLDGGSPPRVNAAKPPGQWQTMDIIFQAARFDQAGSKTSHARFVKVVQNGQVIQENVEVPWACGPNWDRQQFPKGPIILQGDYGPVAFRNVSVRPWQAGAKTLNVPPEGFTALFNGRDFTGWRLSPKAREMWLIEDGVLKSPGVLREWGADLVTEKTYRDFVLMLDFRMPTISDSGIMFRRLVPEIPNFGDQEQFNLRSKSGVGELESYYFLPHGIARHRKLREEDEPHLRRIDPAIGVWHTVKLTMQGRTLSAEYDGEVLYDRFTYPDWLMNLEPAPIRLQKHVFFDDNVLGRMNPCPIEYRNIFIKELGSGADVPAKPRIGAAPGSKLPAASGLKPANRWKWSAPMDGNGGCRKEAPLTLPDGRTLYVTSFGVSGADNKPPVVLLPGSHLRVRGRVATAQPVFVGITIHHPNRDFAGRFQAICPADQFQSGKDFELTLQLRDLQLDPSLADQKDKLPSMPDYFEVESIWLHTLDKQAGMEIDGVELISPAKGGGTGRPTMTPIGKPGQPARPKPEAAATRPNVVILLADDLGYADLGCYGGPVKTPTLDALATQGVRFTDFHAGAAVCSPSRATLLTGRQHIRTGIYGVLQDTMHNAHLLEREMTIAEVLKQSGYTTAHFGKWHLGLTWSNRKKPSPTEHGFDYWFGLANGAGPSQKDPVNFIRNGKRVGPLKGYSCQIVVDDAIRWLTEKRPSNQPFFLNVWFNEPHSVLAAPDEIVSQYGGLGAPAALYSGAVDNTDRAVGRLLAKLKDMGVVENTLIIYSSDNGSYRNDRNGGLRGAKGSNFEGGIRSPGIFFWPRGIRGGRVEKEPAGSVDLLPTICGLLGIAKPEGVDLDGADLSPLLTGRGRFQRSQPLFWYLPTSYPAAAIRDGRYALMAYRNYDLPQDQRAISTVFKQIAKLVRKEDGNPSDAELRTRIFNQQFDEPEVRQLSLQYVWLNTFQESWIPLIKAGGFGRFELYDVDADPKQERDISAQQPEVAARLKQQLLALNASIMADAPDWVAAQVVSPSSPQPDSPNATLLARIERNNLPDGYDPWKHQEYLDRRMVGLSKEQGARIGQLWKEKQRLDPNMKNRGQSFVRIMMYVAGGEKLPTEDSKLEKPSTDDPAGPRGDDTPKG